MNKYELVSKIERFAPLETQEDWDCSGWIVDNTSKTEVSSVMLALTITDDVYKQAKLNNCDLIISHHPLFYVPLEYKDIQIYASHTPLDKAKGGTTETLIKTLGFKNYYSLNEFVRCVDIKISVNDLRKKLEQISGNVRMINNKNKQIISSIAFCSGSGAEFINKISSDCYITGDLKYHNVVESDKVLFDIGHFESEVLILSELVNILGIKVRFANEKSPFI